VSGKISEEGEQNPTDLESAVRELEKAFSEALGEDIKLTPGEDDKPDSVLLWMLSDLEMSVRTALCLLDANIVYIGDLTRLSEAELSAILNFNSKSLHEIKAILAGCGLHLGLDSGPAASVNLVHGPRQVSD
jgi:DNA-directed RNA polymerase subunit alpha